MWYENHHNNVKPHEDVTAKMLALKGELSHEQAQATLAEFLFANPAFMVDLIAGIKLFPMQEVIIKGWMRNDYNLGVMGRGVSKTLTYNRSSQLLSRDHGLIALPDLLPNVDFSKEGWVDIPDIHLWNGEAWQLTSKIYVQPQKDCLRLTTRDGYALEGSTNHLIKVLNLKTLKAEWKTYHEIEVGDYACISRSESEWGDAATQQDLDEAYLMGLLIGDGCYAPSKNGGVGITSIDEEILAFFERFPHTKRYAKSKTAAVDIDLTREYGREFQAKYGFKSCLSYDKAIPASILKSKVLSRECLRGLFDTDGTASKSGALGYSTVSECLSHQVQLLLLTFGIVSTRTMRKTPSPFGRVYTILIGSADQDIFAERIGFRLMRKRVMLESNAQKKRNTNKDVVPGVKEYAQRVKNGYRLKGKASIEWRDKIRRKTNQFHLTYDSMAGYIDFFERNDVSGYEIAPMRIMAMDHFYYSPITKIDSFKHDCIDFNVPTGSRYWANGFINHNSWTVSLFALIWAMLNPGNRIVIVSFAFRASRRILEQCEKFINEKDAALLRAAFPDEKPYGLHRKTDEWLLKVPNGATIQCLPLGDGTKIRGTRADTLIVDEFAYLPEDIIGEVLRPFLTANNKIKEQIENSEREDKLIAQGIMTEEERTVINDFKKVIFLSSACFEFEHMFKRYTDWTNLLMDDKRAEEIRSSGTSYFVSRIGYEAAPAGLLNMKEIEEAKKDISEAMFKREYGAIFSGDSDGYFRASKMLDCSVKDKESPCLELTGERGAEYVLGIDQALSGSEGADHFAMCLMKLVKRPTDERRIGMVVHSYAVAGGNLKDHMTYLLYLLTNFNIIYIALDASQGDELEFVNSCNQSKAFKEYHIALDSIEADFKKDDYRELPVQIRRSYNRTSGRILQKQPFGSAFQRAANEHLQACFDHRRILFGGKISANDAATSCALDVDLSLLQSHADLIDPETKRLSNTDMMELQDRLLDLTRKECAMIQVKATELGTMTFGLPQSAKRTSGPSKTRKDSYSALLLCNWAVHLYLMSLDVEVQTGTRDFPYWSGG